MYNLIGNAIKFTENGTIKIAAKAKKKFIKITIEDTGIGIPNHKREDIFRSFEQVVGDSRRQYGGTGLGLTIARRLAELMGGTLTLEWSEVGIGSKFAFTVPISNKQNDNKKLDPILENKKEISFDLNAKLEINKSGKYKILVVDDEISNLYVLINLLAKEDCDIITATSGQAALDIIKDEGKIDLILLDVMMPKMSGYEVCRKIRERTYTYYNSRKYNI